MSAFNASMQLFRLVNFKGILAFLLLVGPLFALLYFAIA